MQKIHLASDNWSGCPDFVLDAICQSSQKFGAAYGKDSDSLTLENTVKTIFQQNNLKIFLVGNGTAANVLALSSLLKPHQAVLCTEVSHLHVDECGSLERLGGNKLILVHDKDGKMLPSHLEELAKSSMDVHRVQPKLVSLTQPTEYGTLYSQEELEAISQICQKHDLLLHIDGARIANALAILGSSWLQRLAYLKVSALSFGFMKNGGAFGEMLISFVPDSFESLSYSQKQLLQLNSKQRLVSAQILSLLHDNRYIRLAHHANQMATRLKDGLISLGYIPTRPVDCNSVFVCIPPHIQASLSKHSHFYEWNAKTHEVRLMCSWSTQSHEIEEFLKILAQIP